MQMLRTGEQLEQMGVTITLDNSEELDVAGYDVVHVFNTLAMPAAYYQILNAKRQGTPVVYSTIYWNVAKMPQPKSANAAKRRAAANALIRRVTGRELVSRAAHARSVSVWLQQEAALLASDCLLPNAETELAQIRESFPRVRNTARVIPNGVSEDIATGSADRFRASTGITGDFVLCLANISPRKNQFRLAQACRSLGLPLVLVGGCNEANSGYLKQCKEAGGDRLTYLGPVPHSATKDCIAACRVHVLASELETPGLATLEAAACGKSIVVCDRGSVREYVGEEAHYCDYLSMRSIRNALRSAWESSGSEKLANRVLTEFTWRRAAEKTLAAYREVLERYG